MTHATEIADARLAEACAEGLRRRLAALRDPRALEDLMSLAIRHDRRQHGMARVLIRGRDETLPAYLQRELVHRINRMPLDALVAFAAAVEEAHAGAAPQPHGDVGRFLAECTRRAAAAAVADADLMRSYADWCRARGRRPVPTGVLATALLARGLVYQPLADAWSGIGWTAAAPALRLTDAERVAA